MELTIYSWTKLWKIFGRYWFKVKIHPIRFSVKFLLIFFQFCGSGETRRFPPELCFSSGFVLQPATWTWSYFAVCSEHCLLRARASSAFQAMATLSPFLQKLLKSDQTGLGDTLALSLSYSNFSNQIRRLCVSVFVCLCVDNQHSLSVSFLQKPDETSVGDSLRTRWTWQVQSHQTWFN